MSGVEAPASPAAETAPPDAAATTLDAFLGGRVIVEQPAQRGHRAGFDAVVLAACLPPGTVGRVADLGAGVGVAGLCAAARLALDEVIFVERDPETLALLSRNLVRNAGLCGGLVAFASDIAAPGAARRAAGLVPGRAEHVIMNPPFHPAGRSRVSPDAARAGAHMAADGDLDRWLRTAASLLTPDAP
ncbi:methyltransferase [Methylobrevis pamukkalensis]|uniref:tRNA1(Val) (Adenine(37)-N6)-methyltransferase n=1 Tax=Methylobrevis pamukkalensis TaxID=1439726 RepID=A0A1E3GXX7_9HYPH|nr:methyltransferase [Methylobrevis pamukkalensis]ODN68902.1 tRNA1(Val) (adenine(37)-N6)-methyltransferase [Methylobrevis pamukkalensis]